MMRETIEQSAKRWASDSSNFKQLYETKQGRGAISLINTLAQECADLRHSRNNLRRNNRRLENLRREYLSGAKNADNELTRTREKLSGVQEKLGKQGAAAELESCAGL